MKKKIQGIVRFSTKNFLSLWLYIGVPVLSLVINVLLAEIQNSFGMINIIMSISFLVVLVIEVIFVNKKVLFKHAKELLFPRFEVAFTQMPYEIKNYDYLFEESIISDEKLSEFESNCSCEEIWVVSNDLQTEVDGGLYAEIVPNNLNRGIKYKIFVPKNNLNSIRLEHLKRRNKKFENIKYYLLTDDFFFLVSKLDFTIYDPYKTSATGRKGYIGLDLPDCDVLYAAKVDDPLVDAIASKLLEYIQKDKFEQI